MLLTHVIYHPSVQVSHSVHLAPTMDLVWIVKEVIMSTDSLLTDKAAQIVAQKVEVPVNIVQTLLNATRVSTRTMAPCLDQEHLSVMLVILTVDNVQLLVLAHVILVIVMQPLDQHKLNQFNVNHVLRVVSHVKRKELVIVTRVQLEAA